MDQYPIKTVTFGGFDKQDVIQYIERAAEAQRALQEEVDGLKEHLAVLQEENAAQSSQLEELTAERDRLRSELTRETQARQELETLKPLRAEVERLRPDAEAYAQFRDRVGDIECDAHKRAAELEASTTARLRRTVELFRAQYVTLMSSFESTASHVTAELRKVEVNLSQLPRAMDQAGTELNELAALLDRSTKKEEKEPRG